jgi:acetyl esterase/lipase
MMLSRKAVRITQIRYLLSNGFLPVSIDYRLCPELNIFDGPITDVRDAYSWVQNDLNSILRSYDITIDSNRIAAIGWSTGGHLALSLAWTARQAGLTPPTAILSFYAPVDFESGGELETRLEEYILIFLALDTHSERFAPLPKLNQKEILSQLSQSHVSFAAL